MSQRPIIVGYASYVLRRENSKVCNDLSCRAPYLAFLLLYELVTYHVNLHDQAKLSFQF